MTINDEIAIFDYIIALKTKIIYKDLEISTANLFMELIDEVQKELFDKVVNDK